MTYSYLYKYLLRKNSPWFNENSETFPNEMKDNTSIHVRKF